jgi:hypothetical protein
MFKFLIFLTVIMAAMVSVSAQTRDNVSASAPQRIVRDGVVHVGPRSTYLQEGLSTEEVVRLLGEPVTISERDERGVRVTTYEFAQSEGRTLVAEFMKGVLIRSRTETGGTKTLRADESR